MKVELADQQEFKTLQESKGDAFLIKARIHKHAGDSDRAYENYRMATEYYIDQIALNPEDYYAYSKLGLAYAGLGKQKLAIENGQNGIELGKQNFSSVNFPFILYNMALTYAIIGDHKSALNTIQELLATRSLYTLEFIIIDPDLKPLL
jgi:tetratricopeptide (TPR) repeat protein